MPLPQCRQAVFTLRKRSSTSHCRPCPVTLSPRVPCPATPHSVAFSRSCAQCFAWRFACPRAACVRSAWCRNASSRLCARNYGRKCNAVLCLTNRATIFPAPCPRFRRNKSAERRFSGICLPHSDTAPIIPWQRPKRSRKAQRQGTMSTSATTVLRSGKVWIPLIWT